MEDLDLPQGYQILRAGRILYVNRLVRSWRAVCGADLAARLDSIVVAVTRVAHDAELCCQARNYRGGFGLRGCFGAL